MNVFILPTLILYLIALWSILMLFRVGGLFRKLRWLILLFLSAGSGCILGLLIVITSAFYAFSGETLVATVTTKPLRVEEYELSYLSAGQRKEGLKHIHLRGDQWAISGGVIKWHPWLTALGLKSYHKPMRLSGQFSSVTKQGANTPTVYPLEAEKDRFWELIYRLGPYLPFVEAVYGSSAYAYVNPKWTQEIYVTPSGYLIKRKPLRHAK